MNPTRPPSGPSARRRRRHELEPQPPPTSPTRDRAWRLFVGSMTLLAGAGLGWLASDVVHDDRFRDIAAIAEALMQEEAGAAWPPRQHEGRLDAGVPVPPDEGIDRTVDIGPPLPPTPPDRPGFRVRQEQRDGLYLLEAVIGDADFDDPLPMVVVLHGRGDRAHVPGGPFMALSHPVRVVVPQAPDPLGDGWQWLPVRVGDGLVDRLSSTLFETSDRLARFIQSMLDDRRTEGRAIVTGFSQGGLLTLTLAVHHDDVVGHAIPLAAWLPPPLEPSYRRRDRYYPEIRAMHGTVDPIVPIDPTTALFGRLSELGFDVELVQVPGVEHTMNADMNRLFHEWLDEAVCERVGDPACAAQARRQAAELRALPAAPPVDAFVPLDGDLGDGAVPDGAAAARARQPSRRRRSRPVGGAASAADPWPPEAEGGTNRPPEAALPVEN